MNLFEVSNFGRVRRNVKFRHPYLYYKGDASKTGYTRVSIFYDPNEKLCFRNNLNSITKRFLVHRLVADAFIPNPNNYPIINHIDGNPQNNYVSNLEWCDYSHNLKHAYSIGLTSRIGSQNSMAKLS